MVSVVWPEKEVIADRAGDRVRTSCGAWVYGASLQKPTHRRALPGRTIRSAFPSLKIVPRGGSAGKVNQFGHTEYLPYIPLRKGFSTRVGRRWYVEYLIIYPECYSAGKLIPTATLGHGNPSL